MIISIGMKYSRKSKVKSREFMLKVDTIVEICDSYHEGK